MKEQSLTIAVLQGLGSLEELRIHTNATSDTTSLDINACITAREELLKGVKGAVGKCFGVWKRKKSKAC